MKVLFISQNDPMYVKEFFHELFQHDHGDVDICGVVMAPPMGKKRLRDLVAQMWSFYGPIDFVRMGCRFAVTKLGSKLPRTLRFGKDFSIQQIADASGIPTRYEKDLNSPSFVDYVRRSDIDVLASIAAPQIIKAPLIRAPKLACINIHNGSLPKYRGMLPNFWQIFDGCKSVGTTVHKINEGIDDGAILAQEVTTLKPNESLDSIIKRTKRSGAVLMLRVLRQLRDGTVIETDNRREDGSYFSFPTKADVREYRRRGNKLL